MTLLDRIKSFFRAAPSKPTETKAAATITYAEPAWVYTFSSSQRPDDVQKASSWVFACADRTATAISAIPLIIRQGAEEIPWNSDHPLAKLLREPIPDCTWSSWVEEVALYAILTGCCYLEKRRATAYGRSEKYPTLGVPVQLWPFGANAFKACVDSLARRQVIEEYEPKVGADKTKLPPSEIVRIAYVRLGKRNEAMSKVEGVEREVSTDRGAAEWQASALKNRGVADAVIEIPDPINPTQEQEVVTQMMTQWVGAKNAHRPLILGSGAKWRDLAKSMVEMEMIAGRKFTLQAICAAMGVPEVLFTISGSTYANLETALLAHVTQTVMPLMTKIVEALNLHVCREYGADIYLEIDTGAVDALLPVLRARWEIAEKPLNRGVPLEQVSEQLRLGITPCPGSNMGFVPSTQIPIESLTTGDADLAPVSAPTSMRGAA